MSRSPSETRRGPRDGGLVVILLVASILTMLNSASFPALVPVLQQQWGLTNTEAGLISGIFYFGYICAVPFTVSLTDHIDAKRIYLVALLITAAAGLAFALFAQGFWSALLARGLAGAGMAGTYMPGLRLITDRTAPERHPRWIAVYTATFSLGTSVSYVATIEFADYAGWQGALLLGAAGALVSAAMILPVPGHAHAALSGRFHLPNMRPVLKNARALRYIALYGLHNWELFAFQSWIVAYLTWTGVQAAAGPDWPKWVSWITGLFLVASMFASIACAELAMRFGRPRVIAAVMALGLVVSIFAGAGAYLPIWATVLACLLFSMLTMADSAAITTGAMFAAADG